MEKEEEEEDEDDDSDSTEEEEEEEEEEEGERLNEDGVSEVQEKVDYDEPAEDDVYRVFVGRDHKAENVINGKQTGQVLQASTVQTSREGAGQVEGQEGKGQMVNITTQSFLRLLAHPIALLCLPHCCN